MNPKITIAIPCHNNEEVIEDALRSALGQEHPGIEILVIDDASTDKTVGAVSNYSLKNENMRLIINENNLGIGKNLEKCMNEAKGKYILYLCGDDVFTNTKVASDVVSIFDKGDPTLGVIGRYYYFFAHGKPGAIGTCREKDILISSCCPSGMAFKRRDVNVSTRIFVEMPSIVKHYIKLNFSWTMMEYDTVASRFHPGRNTGTKTSYFTESPTQSWIDLLEVEDYKDYPCYIMLKNRAPKLLWREICQTVKRDAGVLRKWKFWLYATTALCVPSRILQMLTTFYRNRISRANAVVIERGTNV